MLFLHGGPPGKAYALLPATGHNPNPATMDATHKLLKTEVPRR